jgi:hypothetical protein
VKDIGEGTRFGKENGERKDKISTEGEEIGHVPVPHFSYCT